MAQSMGGFLKFILFKSFKPQYFKYVIFQSFNVGLDRLHA